MSTLTINNSEFTGLCYTVLFYAQNGAPVNTWYEIVYIDVYGNQQTTGFAAGQDVNEAFSVDCKNIISSGGAVQGNSTQIQCPNPCNNYQFGYYGSEPGDTGIVDFINCDGVNAQVTLTWDESNGRYYNISLCATEIISVDGFAMNEGIIGVCGGN